ncbi:hypothetical protein PTSG_06952 [Salpingoeca rosetta]|uniref:SSD domain-containing protein n=1 Tax=Salpingoeca rosetta (strain ATCC 50818 / BSB-021) TaxID=946362 RepID=F2UFA0_SALR5|nr:uncharacterized protein PTSG_06952 [Salpingoeca rosetta]EGD75300.1 hypothetical protein PTSG_06952 [Salpingoeca rosetta]|eukprot:XP_004992353.1 hypothetical protein PTSG_06952 [Salpingoeca rosetta]
MASDLAIEENTPTNERVQSKFKQWVNKKIHWYCRGVIAHPRMGTSILLLLTFVLSGIAFVVYPFDIDTTVTTFIPRTSRIGKLEETRILAEEITRFNPFRAPSNTSSVIVPQQTDEDYYLQLLFSVPHGDNVFTRGRITAMHNMELAIRAMQGDPSFTQVCARARDSTECSQPQSVTRFFFASEIDGCPNVYRPDGNNTDIPFASVDDVLLALITPRNVSANTSLPAFCYSTAGDCYANCFDPSPSAIDFAVADTFGFPDNNASLTPDLTSHVSTSLTFFGLPLAGFKSPDDRYDEQISIIESFVKRVPSTLRPFKKAEGLTTTILSGVLIDDYFWNLIITDTALVSVSVVVVYLYMAFHVNSFFISGMGMLHVLVSFPIAFLFTQAAMDFGAMGILNLMSLFIILGIGADDVFIFVDAWRQSELEVPGPDGRLRRNAPSRDAEITEDNLQWLTERLVWTYTRSSEAMLITSLTTGAAFVMNLSSSVPAIQIFGAFTGLMILFNFILVITYFPFVVVTHHCFIRHIHYPCCRRCCSKTNRTKLPASATQTQLDGVTSNKLVGKHHNINEYRALERFFYKSYAPFICKRRWHLVAVFAIWFGVSIYFASELKAATEPTQWLPSRDKLQQAFDMLNSDFARTDLVPQIVVMYGLEVVDLSGVNPYNPNDPARVVFDSGFDPTAPNFQETFISICERFREEGEFVLEEEILCPMELFRDYVTNELGMAFPVPRDDFVPLLANFTRYYEDNNGPAPDVSGDVSSSEQDAVTRDERSWQQVEVYQTIRFHLDTEEPELAYMFIIVNTTLNTFSAGKDIRPAYEFWDHMLDMENARADNIEATLDGALQTADLYIDLHLEDTLLRAAIVGIAASLSLAFVIIIVMTRDITLSVMSIISIGGVVVSLIALMVMLGWTLGLIESVCLTILVGLSVDYVIHLANAYRESHEVTRFSRVRDALVMMGISVLSASITTFLAGFVLFFGYITFFFKFGVFIALTIFFAAIWAFGFFMSLAAIAGNKEYVDDFVRLWRVLTCKPQALKLGGVNTTTPATEMDRHNGITETKVAVMSG